MQVFLSKVEAEFTLKVIDSTRDNIEEDRKGKENKRERKVDKDYDNTDKSKERSDHEAKLSLTEESWGNFGSVDIF